MCYIYSVISLSVLRVDYDLSLACTIRIVNSHTAPYAFDNQGLID